MMRIFYIDWQHHRKYDRTMNIGANAHGKRAVSTLKIATSDGLDLRWQLGFQWHGIGIELVLQVPRLFHNATVSQCDHFCCYICTCICCLKLHQVGEFFLTQFGGGHSAPIYLCRILISRPPRVFRRFKRRSCVFWEYISNCILDSVMDVIAYIFRD